MKQRIVFIAFNPYHLFVSLYYAITIKERKNIETVLIWQEYSCYNIDPALLHCAFDKIIVNDSIIQKKQSGFVRFIRRIKTGGYIYRFTKNGRYIYRNRINNIVMCFSDQDPTTYRILKILQKGNNNYILLTEEGSAVYNTKAVFNYKKIDYRYYLMKFYFFLGVVHGKYIGSSQLFDAWIVKHTDMLPPVKAANHTIVPQNSIFYDVIWASKLTELNRILLNQVSIDRKKKTVLWVSGPLTECGVKQSEEIDLLREIVCRLDENTQIVIKLHPREPIDKYDSINSESRIIKLDLGEYRWVPIEYIVKMLNPYAVITIMSSAARSIFDNGIRSKFIYCYKLFELQNVDETVLEIDSDFSSSYVINNIDEINNILQEPLDYLEQKNYCNDHDIDFICQQIES